MSRKAFTLIELLVVIAIIALLLSILLPSLSQARDAARRVACLANLRAMGGSIQFYQSDFNDYVMLGKMRWFDTAANRPHKWPAYLVDEGLGYMKEQGDSPDGHKVTKSNMGSNAFTCPSDVYSKEQNIGTFGTGLSYTYSRLFGHSVPGQTGPWTPYRSRDFRKPATTIHITEKFGAYGGVNGVWTEPGEGLPNIIDPRHDRGRSVNVLLFDMHAEPMPTDFVADDADTRQLWAID